MVIVRVRSALTPPTRLQAKAAIQAAGAKAKRRVSEATIAARTAALAKWRSEQSNLGA